MERLKTEQVRNVVLLSHSGAGKTSLVEAMLFDAGVVSRLGRVDDGTTTSDYEPEAVRRKTSINLSVLPLQWKDNKLNILDTPGYADFVGEVRAGLRAADGAVMVVCAASGVEVGTEQTWRYASDQGLPRLIFLNKMDRENADFFRTLGQLRAKFGAKCVPIQLPIGSQAAFQGVVDLITRKAAGGAKDEAIPPSMKDQVEEYREKLVEAVAETDDELITKYLEGEGLNDEEVSRGLKAGTLQGKIVPVLTGAALSNRGIAELLDGIRRYLPSPKEAAQVVARNALTQSEEKLAAEESGPLAALVFKTTADPYVGKLTYFRVCSGVINSDSTVWNANKGRAERLGQLFLVRGKGQEPVPSIIAGDMGGVAKLAETVTGDTLCNRDRPLVLPSIAFPAPVLSVAVHPKSKADLDKMGNALSRIVEEDPTLKVRKDPDTAETILSGMGDAHLDVAAEKMRRKFGVSVDVLPPKVPYKETIKVPVKTEYKHKKQTGGHGQYGHVFLELQPLPRGSGFEFAEHVVGGVVPKNYIPAVEKGVVEAVQEGGVAGYPIVDIKVTLYDGSYHAVDSSDIAFKIAASHALRKGMSQGQPILLEPIVNLHITVPDNFTGDVIGDLNTKRARVLGMTPQDGANVIEAQAPLAEVQRYATTIRSITQGRGSYTIEFSHYEEVPAHIAQKIAAQAKKEAEKA